MAGCTSIYASFFILLYSVIPIAIFGQEREADNVQSGDPVTLSINKSVEEANNLYNNENFTESYKAFKKIIERSNEARYPEGIVEGKLGAAKCLYLMGKLDKSTSLLLSAKKYKYARRRPNVMMEIHFQLALNLHALDLAEEAIRYYKLTNKYAAKLKDAERRDYYYSGTLANIGSLYHSQELFDSALHYYYKSYAYSMRDPEAKLASILSIADVYIDKKQQDSATKYIGLCNEYSKEVISPYYTALNGRINGKYKYFQGYYEEAIQMFKAAQQLNAGINYIDPALFKLQADSFLTLGEVDSANFYLQKYLSHKEDLQKIDNKKVASLIFADEKEAIERKSSAVKLIILGGSLLAISITVFLIVRQRKRLSEKNHETRVLKKQLNNAFEEVVELAKNNSPNFLPRFIEVYPEFYKAIVRINPDLKNTDLMMCVYLRLDFSTKEIADYTFASVRTIQNRRFRLRKKLHLKSEEDIGLWIKKLSV